MVNIWLQATGPAIFGRFTYFRFNNKKNSRFLSSCKPTVVHFERMSVITRTDDLLETSFFLLVIDGASLTFPTFCVLYARPMAFHIV